MIAQNVADNIHIESSIPIRKISSGEQSKISRAIEGMSPKADPSELGSYIGIVEYENEVYRTGFKHIEGSQAPCFTVKVVK